MGRYERHEIGSVGFDDFLQLVGSDQFNTPNASWIRIPDFPGPMGGPNVRYVALCSAADLDKGDFIVGVRQLVVLAATISTADSGSGPPLVPQIFIADTPGWHFVDGFHSFALYKTAGHATRPRVGPFDTASFKLQDSTGPAMLYQTAAGLPSPQGYLGLTGYTPPPPRGVPELFFRDVRARWQENEFHSLRYEVPSAMRFRLYCLLLQTNPATRPEPALPPNTWDLLAPEDGFIQAFPRQVNYHAVAGSLIIESKRGRDALLPRNR